MKKDNLGDRMKGYEDVSRIYLIKRTPIILRIDGKAFQTYTKGLERPFSSYLADCFWETTKYVAKEMMGVKVAYHQSDEVSFLLTNYHKVTTESWFDNNLQKMVSVAASLFTYKFNDLTRGVIDKPALFDCRSFVLPKEEVVNYFIWRQQEASKNSVSMFAQSNFPHKALQGLNGSQLQEKLFQERNINWNDIPTWQKRGVCITKEQFSLETENGVATRTRWDVDMDIPIFTQDRSYIEKFV
ncbi:tRNA(His) guanylyltransferase Thg1 family protein [Paenibacillus sp. O199]|uniref:tRNA(His) guanylyltransferase Thg1 family protein n=1 Tax=Paenibacillus sp. O199 TaxID=1643925 RepID=UPI0007BF69F1|nr:tRNA(His) guanylyltransferase Thg1 family protein [Paenibacillus sp. O199]